jgi:cell surface protein SprA
MFISAHSEQYLEDSAAVAFLRVGTDFDQNYYEIEVPLHYIYPYTGIPNPDSVWKSDNHLNVAIEDLVAVKVARNESSEGGINYKQPFAKVINGRNIIVVGNPDLNSVQTLLIGIKNPYYGKIRTPIQTCIWADELIVSDFVEYGGYAATASLNIQLADLATVTSSIRYIGIGFGSLDQKVSQRALNSTLQYSIASNIALDKFLPQKLGIKLPFYVSHDRKLIMPQYDPLNPDVKLKESIKSQPDSLETGYKSKVMDETVTNSWNFTNVRKVKTKPGAKTHFYDVENLAFSFGVTHISRQNWNLKEYDYKNWKAGVGYTFNSTAKVYEPFKNLKGKSPYLKAIKDFNFSLRPSSVTVRGDLNRQLTKTVYYAGNPIYDIYQDPLYQKSFTFNRTYGLNWNFTRNLTGDFSASSFSVIDEPVNLDPGSKEYNDSVMYQLSKFGRMKNYTQNAALSYKVPFDKFPLTQWLGADTRYSANYNWIANAKDLKDTLGNMITNKQDISVNGRVSLDRLYNQVKFLKEINSPTPVRQVRKVGVKQ